MEIDRANTVFSFDTQCFSNPLQSDVLIILMNSGLVRNVGPGFSTTFKISSNPIICDFRE